MIRGLTDFHAMKEMLAKGQIVALKEDKETGGILFAESFETAEEASDIFLAIDTPQKMEELGEMIFVKLQSLPRVPDHR
ncbi:MAG: hypothetical protein A2Y82_02510 [Candidatus Buchananbacteria bacterium RBG_13_36_9]|uniref:Uncharacterized protein n=1 Tax=Candidatus Buchananbacteria bacterium RBG_13_36_9 TaxID=1797530 RepID=A0A1G1XNU5_9BACT|nr:MAG: hypothetical protein A2Y82_02510 [Candidatus Buchananbacteria bacterium RBG_13_36_9]